MSFQSTPLWEGRPLAAAQRRNPGGFNPRPCGRGDARQGAVRRLRTVSIHAPVGGATAQRLAGGQSGKFQSTPLWEGRRGRHGRRSRRQGFNPRPCGRGDASLPQGCGCKPCFNPRPCGRGDGRGDRLDLGRSGFNPRPCGRGDADPADRAVQLPGFNPRPCGRGDMIYRPYISSDIVSIHAPVGGATGAGLRSRQVDCGFNPRPCGRGDLSSAEMAGHMDEFQSTPLWEGRPTKAAGKWGEACFNPRPCGRGDPRR